MELVLQTTINTLILSAMFIMVGLGFAFLFNMLNFFHVSHGTFYMVAGYLGYELIGAMGLNPWFGLVIVVLLLAAFGLFFEKFVVRPHLPDFNRQVMVGVAVTAILTQVVSIVIGSRQFSIPSLLAGNFGTGAFAISKDRVLVFVIGSIALLLITLFINRTKWGLHMRGITQNMDAAILQGIDVPRISGIICALGCALAAIAGVLAGTINVLDPYMGEEILLKCLIMVTLAGAGSVGGIFIVGLILGVLYSALPILTSGIISDAVAIVLVCIILLARPQGFFGHET
jgi:branched-chain amino acid transport system permease protein